jgi:nucleoid-associated protein YgaU
VGLSAPAQHDVVTGDSYWRLAEKYYGPGNGRFYNTIRAANGDKALVPGMRITIPATPAETESRATQPASAARRAAREPAERRSAATSRIHVVRKGDTLSGLAQKYYGDGSKWEKILEANRSVSYTNLRPGQKLTIPAK